MPLPAILVPILGKFTSFLSAQGAKVIAAAIAIIVVCVLIFLYGKAVKNAALYKEKYQQEQIKRQESDERYNAREVEIKKHDAENIALLKKAYSIASDIAKKNNSRNKNNDFDIVKANMEIYCILHKEDDICTTPEK